MSSVQLSSLEINFDDEFGLDIIGISTKQLETNAGYGL